MENQSQGWLGRLGKLLVPNSEVRTEPEPGVSNRRILDELVAAFAGSIQRESVGASMLFNAHFLIILHPNTYENRINAFPVIVSEAVREFEAVIETRKEEFERVSPVASSWFFKFGAGKEFGGENVGETDVFIVGALSGILPGPAQAPASSRMQVTRRVKQTNRYEKVDVDPYSFQHIDFREPGAFVVKFSFTPKTGPVKEPPARPVVVAAPAPVRPSREGFAVIQYYLADQNKEETHAMLDREIVVARKEPDNLQFPNFLLIDSPYVSNPHARIRYNDAASGFEIASFSRNETRVNEQLIPRSEPASPEWHPLPDPSQILLNSVVTLNFEANR